MSQNEGPDRAGSAGPERPDRAGSAGPKRVALIVNPTAAGVKPAVARDVEAALAAVHTLQVAETNHRDHATELARQAAADGVDVVVVLGGDGTLNEAANGLVGSDTAIAPLPGGSTSVYARTVGYSRRPRKAAEQVNAAIASGSIRRVGTGSVNGRQFLFHLGVGFDAAVVGRVEGMGTLKRRLGQAVFVYAAFATWFRHYDRKKPGFSVEFADGERVDDGYFAICLNTNPYTYLGRMSLDVAPEANPSNGLSMVTLRTLKVGTLLGVTGKAARSKKGVAGRRHVSSRSDLEGLVIEGHGPVPFQVDGDYLGVGEHLRVEHHPDRLLLVAPPQGPERPD